MDTAASEVDLFSNIIKMVESEVFWVTASSAVGLGESLMQPYPLAPPL